MTDKILSIVGLNKKFGNVDVLLDINIELESGGFLVLVGPSGCGKSTLLNCLAGFEAINSGSIEIGGKDVENVSPKDRDIAMVFQSYALYPTMTVEKNITFGMEARGVKKEARDANLARVSQILQIEPLLKRKPGQLSGGQRQRVAMGRALVRDPKLFLFDEPLSNLDAKLRVDMRTEIKKLHNRLNASIVYVTHDQIEALTLATKIVVMKDGLIQQIGTPDEIYNRPGNIFVADFMGSPPMNLIPVKAIPREKHTEIVIETRGEHKPIILKDLRPELLKSLNGKTEIILGLRPEHITNLENVTGQYKAVSECVVDVIEPVGSDIFVITELGGKNVTARLRSNAYVELGKSMKVVFDLNNASYFYPKTGIRYDF
ncbi:MAG: ABC transporter ATP-binding protein [Rhodobacterales bacterium]|jgi:multiple sugar transport system ATP-binding protein|tara:strand:+ start:5657 stop:6778 length:1122 start_codon:yes stop_codon:yes gene_type:complete